VCALVDSVSKILYLPDISIHIFRVHQFRRMMLLIRIISRVVLAKYPMKEWKTPAQKK